MQDSAKPRSWDNGAFSSHGAFYREVYGDAVVRQRTVGRVSATLTDAAQTSGDWSDAAVPELIVTTLVGAPIKGVLDLGAGRFEGTRHSSQIVVIAPETGTSIVVEGAHTLRMVAMPYAKLLNLAGEDAGLPKDGDFGPLHQAYQSSQDIVGIIRRLWGGAAEDAPGTSLAADGRLLELAGALLRLRGQTPPRLARGGLSPRTLRHCLDALADETNEPALADLARLTGLSGSHLARAFKISTGVTPHAWAARHRLAQAEARLDRSTASIADIADQCGFASQQHFTTAFKRHTGATPAAWRRERAR